MYSYLLRYDLIFLDIPIDIWKNLQYSRISQDIKDILSYFRYVDISQKLTYLKMTEISYILADI